MRAVRKHLLVTALATSVLFAAAVDTAVASPTFFGKPQVTSRGLIVPFKTELKGTLTLSGTGLQKTVTAFAAGTTLVKVPFTSVGRRLFKAHEKIHLLEVAKLSDESTASSTYVIRL